MAGNCLFQTKKNPQAFFNTSHNPPGDSSLSLFSIQDKLRNEEISLDDIPDFFELWRSIPSYICLHRWVDFQKTFIEDSSIYSSQYLFIKACKRGNDVYFYRMRRKFSPLLDICDGKDFLIKKEDDGWYSNILHITLTYDTSRCSIEEAWKNIGKEWNCFLSFLKQNFGLISVLRVWEAFGSGYPHIHAIVLFPETFFRVQYFPGYTDREGKKHYDSWRVVDKDIIFEKAWHSFVDVRAISSLEEFKYILKYILKQYKKEDSSYLKQVKTLSMCWVFRKQSFSISHSFYDDLDFILRYLKCEARLDISAMYNSNKNNSMYKNEHSCWVFLGVFSAWMLRLPIDKWLYLVTKPPPGLYNCLIEYRRKRLF